MVMPEGNLAMGLSNDTSVLASPASGTVTLEARALARGEQAWLWTVDARDGDGRLCAHSRVTVAVRPFSG
jgi:1,4-dihydroxy-2-naphthoyl-CoA hydrolase